MNNYDWLISKIDAFTRKYYANQLLRGGLIFTIALLCYVLTISVGEYYLYFPTWLRWILLSLFIIAGLWALVRWVIIPLIKMARMGNIISHEEAAIIIGRHFPEISDKLLNILQLKKQSDSLASRDLIEASIQQKAAQLSVLPITQAVDLKKNKKYLPYLMPLIGIAIFILIFSPGIFTEASERLLQPAKTFEKPAPFEWVIMSEPLSAVRNTDYVLKVKTTGAALPEQVAVMIDGEKITMTSTEKNHFEYRFKNVTEDIPFRLYAAGYTSKAYTVKIVQKPVLKAISFQLDYPEYTGKKDEQRTSLGDISVPEGTRITWNIAADFADNAFLQWGATGTSYPMQRKGKGFSYAAQAMHDTTYALVFTNQSSKTKEAYTYHLQVVPDEHPIIQLQEHRDTISGKQVLLSGTAGDDYGISKVNFHYQIVGNNNQLIASKAVPLKVSGGTLTTFQYYFDIDLLQLQIGQKLNYYIEAWDNDAVNGSKSTKSEMHSYHMLLPKQLDSAIHANAQQINSGLSKTSQQSKELRNDIKELQSKLLQSDKMDWERQQSLQEMMTKQMELKQNLEQIKKRFDEQVQQSKQKEHSEDLQDKQQELQKQLDHMLSKELQEMMKKLEEMMAKLNKDNALQQMKEMEQQNKLFNMDLDRMKELMKKLEMQMRMEDLAEKATQLAAQQDALQKETTEQKKSNEALSKEQQELKKQLDEMMKKDMGAMKELNQQMKQEQDLNDIQQSGNDAQQNMQESGEQLGQNQNGKAGQKQSQASKNLKEMASALKKAASGNSMEQIELDIKAVRQILTNLMRLSFDQESLMSAVRTTSPTTQTYLLNVREQNRLHQNAHMIKDSLFSLSKRLFKLAPTINKETSELEKNLQLSKDALEGRRIAEAVTKQQYVMMRTNNLALMLNETLANLLQMQSQQMKEGEKQGSCQKPGGKTPKPGAGKQMSDIITQQQDLGNALQQMKDAQEKRQGTQGQKQGQQQQPGGEEYGNAEQLARMAAQQAALRKQLQDLQRLLNSKGLGNAKELRDIQNKMDKNETDLVNRRLSSELLLRQKEILSRLLETEKALREQEQDDKRSSKNPTDILRSTPPELQRYLQSSQNLMDVYKTIPPQLRPYYKEMVNHYYKNLGVSTK